MDTIKVMLTMVAALLTAALIVTVKDFKRARAAEPPEKVWEVDRQIAEIRQNQALMQATRSRITGKPVPAAPATPPATAPDQPNTGPPPPDLDLSAIDGASSLSNPEVQEDPAPGETEEPAMQSPEERAKLIAAAPVVAKIVEWLPDGLAELPDLGPHASLQIVDASSVKTDTVLCIRRNAGILGRLKVGAMDGTEAIGNPFGDFVDLKLQPGDELILDPQAGR